MLFDDRHSFFLQSKTSTMSSTSWALNLKNVQPVSGVNMKEQSIFSF